MAKCPETEPISETSVLTDAEVLSLNPSEERLIRYMRALGYGSLDIRVVAGCPVLIEQVIKQVKLT